MNNNVIKSKTHHKHSLLNVAIIGHHLGPVLEPWYAMPWVGNFPGHNFCVIDEVSHLTVLGTIVYRLHNLMPTYATL
jgi:hypothetical protein